MVNVMNDGTTRNIRNIRCKIQVPHCPHSYKNLLLLYHILLVVSAIVGAWLLYDWEGLLTAVAENPLQEKPSDGTPDEQMIAFRWKASSMFHRHGEFVDPWQTLETIHGVPFDRCHEEFVQPTTTTNKAATAGIPSSNKTAVLGIDQIHRQGFVHLGVWIFVVDNQQRILLSKRGPSMVTCPNSWTLVGEHSMVGEELHPEKTVLRGLQEEIGPFLLEPRYMKRAQNLMSNKNNNKNKNRTKQSGARGDGMPVYYLRHYGPSLDNRIDRQVTYFWIVELQVSGDVVVQQWKQTRRYHNREEMTEMNWVTIHELTQGLAERPNDFCHETIHSFFRIGLKALKQWQEKR